MNIDEPPSISRKRIYESSSGVTSEVGEGPSNKQDMRTYNKKDSKKTKKIKKLQILDPVRSPEKSYIKKNRLIDLEPEEDAEREPEKPIYDKFCTGPYLLLIKFKMGVKTANRLSPIDIARKLSKANVKFDTLENHNYNTWKIFFISRAEANQTINNRFLKELDLTAFIPRFKLFRKGVIKQIPLDIPNEEIKYALENDNQNVRVNKIHRLKCKDKSQIMVGINLRLCGI